MLFNNQLMNYFANSMYGYSRDTSKLFYAIVPSHNNTLIVLTTDLSTKSTYTADTYVKIYKYNCSAININNHTYPVIPLHVYAEFNWYAYDKIISWIFIIYSQRFKLDVKNELLMYIFFIESMQIINCPNILPDL